MGKIRIGTRESQLAIWQAEQVKNLLTENGFEAELVYIKTEGDIDLVTPLYEIGVEGIFTRSLDAALLNNRIDVAVHSMKDVPVQLAQGIRQAAVLKRGSHKDIFVPHPNLVHFDKNFGHVQERIMTTMVGSKTTEFRLAFPVSEQYVESGEMEPVVIATSSIRRIAQWLNIFPHDKIENLRGNINTRLRKLKESKWHGAIFAAAGLERIGLRPENSIELDWMLPAPAQGAIIVVCRENDEFSFEACVKLNDDYTALCTKIERDFLKQLLGGCSTPISAFAHIKKGIVYFSGNILSRDGKKKFDIAGSSDIYNSNDLGIRSAATLLQNGGIDLMEEIRSAGK